MKSVLYIVTKSAQSWPNYQFILNPGPNIGKNTVVFLENRGLETEFFADHVYELKEGQSDNMKEEGGKPSTPSDSISYRELLGLIFSSDHSVVV